MSGQVNRSKNIGIECLRALAVLGVLLEHARGNLFHDTDNVLNAIHTRFGFWWGVDLFFAVSGYVIARSFLPRLDQARDRRESLGVLGAFWIRRCWRLLPSAWLWLAIVLIASVAFNQSGAFGSWHANVMATLAGMLSVANFRLAQTMFHSEYGASFVYWSLSLEEQFYLLFPLAAFFLRRWLPWLIAALALVQLFVIRTPWLMMLRTDALALGVLLAMAEQKKWLARLEPRFLLQRPLMQTLLMAAACIGMAICCRDDLALWRYRVGAIAVLAALLVWLASYPEEYLPFRGVSRRVLAWIGARSYAIYLIHVPTFFFMREVCTRLDASGLISHWPSSWLVVPAALAVVMLLANANYRFVETPLRRYGAGLATRFERRYMHNLPDAQPLSSVAASA